MIGSKSIVYLACPYSDNDPKIRAARFEAVNKVAALLMSKGEHVFSPISHCHPIALQCTLPLSWEQWKAFDRAFIEVSRKVYVLTLPGWKESIGVTAEIAIAKELEIPIEYLTYKTKENECEN